MITRKIGQAMAKSAERHNSSRQEKLTVLKKAIEIIRTTKQWSVGQDQSVFDGVLGNRSASIYLKNENTGINLYLFIEGKTLMDRFYSQPFKVGYFNPGAGFQISIEATEASYLAWNLKTRIEMGKEQK